MRRYNLVGRFLDVGVVLVVFWCGDLCTVSLDGECNAALGKSIIS